MTPTLYHTLKNYMRGWSSFHVNPLDIRKIIEINYHQRLFCIFDREYKFTLKIKYYNPRSESNSSLVMTAGGHVGVAFNERYVESSYMTVRYKTENEIKQEIEKINNLQNIIKKFDEEQCIKLNNFAINYNLEK